MMNYALLAFSIASGVFIGLCAFTVLLLKLDSCYPDDSPPKKNISVEKKPILWNQYEK